MLRQLILIAVALSATFAHAQGGPPFRTDDPDTPGNRNWEINIGLVGARNPGAGSYQLPDLDINYGLGDRIQLKYEIPFALQETRPQPGTATDPATPGLVVGGVGASYPGIKWRFYEHHPNDPWLKDRFGTGLLALFGHHPDEQKQPTETPAGAEPAAEPVTNFSLSTYPQLALNNPTRSVARGVIPNGPNFFLPLEFNGRIGPIRYNGEVGYYFGNRSTPQQWGRGFLVGHELTERTEIYAEIYDLQDANRVKAGLGTGAFETGLPKQRQTTVGIGGRQALNHAKSVNLLLLGERSFQAISAGNSQPSWIGYVGVQVLFGPHPVEAPQVETKLPIQTRP
jgi:hypothetical protein